MGRGWPLRKVSQPLPPPGAPSGGAPGMDGSVAGGVAVRLTGASIGAAARRSVVSGGDSTIGSDARDEGDGSEAAAGRLSVPPLPAVGGGAVARGSGLAFCGREGLGGEAPLARLALTTSRGGRVAGSLDGTSTTGDSSMRACSGSVDAGGLPALRGSKIGGTAVENTGHPLSTSGTDRSALAARATVTTNGRARVLGLPTCSPRKAGEAFLRLLGPKQPEQSGSAAARGAEHAVVCRQLASHARQ